MDLSASLKEELEKMLGRLAGGGIIISGTKRIFGGDINNSMELETNKGPFFLKLNDCRSYPGMFEKESRGLETLYRTKTITVPRPLFQGIFGDHQYLVTTFLERESPAGDFWEEFGRGLAAMHRCSAPQFGFTEDNYIGTLPQSNKQHADWSSFYMEERLEPLIRQAYEQRWLPLSLHRRTAYLYKSLSGLFPREAPALLHGDLWSGNFMAGPGGKACIYDPAAYYGHREMDLAMTRLFGGFDKKFYAAYEEAYPLAAGWQERLGICQLYPLLVHALLFGGSYVNSVTEILKGY